jgi:CubicO group peptidase (beta-lactamase class C family)
MFVFHPLLDRGTAKATNLGGSTVLIWLAFVAMASCSASARATASTDPDSLRAILDAKIGEVVRQGSAPSVQVAVVYQDQVVWSKAYGADASPHDVYMNASVQKAFTATAVLQLMDRGLVDLDADVSDYVPIRVRHPEFPDVPVTLRMLLAHRSGLNSFPDQFDWDTKCVFSPRFRPRCRSEIVDLSLNEYLEARLIHGTPDFSRDAWGSKPGEEYRYSVSAYPFLRYLVEQVTGLSYADYMRQNIFHPLGMEDSGFSVGEAGSRHTVPHTRIEQRDVELPIWDGNGFMMHTSAEDMARFMIPFLDEGRVGDIQLLQGQTQDLMMERVSRFRGLSSDLTRIGHGLGLFSFQDGWFGNGGSAPGFQALWRFNPSRGLGYVIMMNVNGILVPGEDLEDLNSARQENYEIQDELLAILDSLG